MYLSSLQAFISNAIYEADRSLKPPSTPSRSISVRPLSFLYHHPPPRHLNTLPTTRRNTATSPSSHVRDVGSITNASSRCRTANPSHTRPSPFHRDVGGSFLLDRVIGEGETRRGGRPMWCVPKMNHNLRCGSFSSPSVLPPSH